MAIDQRVRQEDILDKLIRDQGLEHFAPFFVTGEGKEMPGDLEESSGYVLDTSGRVYSFWLGWSERLGEPVFTEWQEIKPESAWNDAAEYQRAREILG